MLTFFKTNFPEEPKIRLSTEHPTNSRSRFNTSLHKVAFGVPAEKHLKNKQTAAQETRQVKRTVELPPCASLFPWRCKFDAKKGHSCCPSLTAAAQGSASDIPTWEGQGKKAEIIILMSRKIICKTLAQS